VQSFFQRGGWWVLGQGALLSLLVICGILWHSQWQSKYSMACGIALLAIGSVLGIAGTLALGQNLTPFPEPVGTKRLVQHGIYARIRHPLYTAVICASFGFAILFRTWPGILSACALAIFLDRKARSEERSLQRAFPEYMAYQHRVRRFVPWFY
jgi:protein-S-isoprenylcysteine O-methyltransferase Ste14